MELHPNIIPHEHVLRYITAGRPVFTAQGKEHRFTFKLKRPKFDGIPAENMFYVYVLTGPDNTSSYTFMGYIIKKMGRWELRTTNKSKIRKDAMSFVAFDWIMRRLSLGRDLGEVEIWHDGRCACCHRPLTVPESIRTGIGPKCLESLGLPANGQIRMFAR